MPLPTGHTAIGFTICSLCSRGRSNFDRWKILVGVILLSNLPDVDVVAGLIFRGNGSAFHRGPTHSLLFALVTGILASNGWRIWSRIPKFSFLNCFLIILSHVLADAIFTGSKISFLWPFAVNWSEGCMGWRAVIDAILCGNHLNFKIAVACGLFVYLCREVRGLRVFKKWTRLNIVSKLHDSTLPSLKNR
jgi:inner membrane protein